MRINKITTLLITISLLSVLSCKQEEYKAPVSNAVNMAGRWYVQLLEDINTNGEIDEDDILIYSYHDFGEYTIITANTSDNKTDSIVFYDKNSIVTPANTIFPWNFKAKFPINYSNLSFTPATVKNLDNFNTTDSIYESVRVIKGQIIKNAATLLSGRSGDSIYINLEFSDDPGLQYILSGHRDSGLPEDQH